MKPSIYLFIVFLNLILFSCKKAETIEVDNNQQLFDKYDGTYPIVSAYLEEPQDLNFDGIASTNLLSEIPDVSDSDLQIYISKQTNFLIIQWAEQYPIYDNGDEPYFIYAKQGPHLDFDLNEDETAFIYGPLEEDPALTPDKIKRFASPIKLTIEDDGTIKAIISKTFYTGSSEQDLIVEAVFKKGLDDDRVYH